MSRMTRTVWATLVVGALAMAGHACSSSEDEDEGVTPADAVKPLNAKGPLVDAKFPFIAQANTADLPERCSSDRNVWFTKPLCPNGPAHGARGQGSGGRAFDANKCDWKEMGFESLEAMLFDGILYGDVRRFPEFIHFAHATDYYTRRAEIQQKMEARIAVLPEADQPKAWSNYSVTLVYLGEFKKINELFGPGGSQHEKTNTDPAIVFDLSHSLYRLGKYEDALFYAIRAAKWIPGHDTKWNLAQVEIALYGEEYFERASTDIYSLEHVKKIFKARDLSGFPFEDVTEVFGMHEFRWGGYGGVNFADMDGDGWEDLLAEFKFFPPMFWKNMEGKGFKAISDEDMGNNECAAVFLSPADYDNDGIRDVARQCCNYDSPGEMIMYKGKDGGMKFDDVTEQAKLFVPLDKYPGAGSAMVLGWGDYNLDGHLDLVVGDYTGPVRLHHNNGDGTFTEVQDIVGMNSPGKPNEFGSIGASFGDMNDDGWPDIWAQGWGWKRLWINNGDGTFKNATTDWGLQSDNTPEKGYMAFTLDANNDGKLDLFAGAFVTSDETPLGVEAVCGCHKLLADDGYDEHEWTTSSTVYINNGDGTVTNTSSKTQFLPFGAMGSNAADWNNDGWQDLIISSGGSYYQQLEPFLFYQSNGADGTYTLITPWNMIGLWGKAHGSAFGDFDHDGDLDVFFNSGGFMPGDVFPSFLMRNTGNDNNFLDVAFKTGLPGTNRDAVGANVYIYYGDGKLQRQELWSGGRFGATNTFRLHFGMAKHEKVDKIVVHWPNKEKHATTLTDIAVNQAIEVNETDDSYHTLWTVTK